MRLFVAMVPPFELALAVTRPVEAALGSILSDLRAVRAEEVHLTLHFLGATEPERVSAIAGALEAALAGAAAPDLVFAGTGVFPSPRAPRVFWIGLKEAEGAGGRLTALRERVLGAVRSAGIPVPEAEQAFAPHLTVARARERARVRATPAFRELSFDLFWRPRTVALVESRPPGRGARYQALREWLLGPPG